ncbi:MAG TPA: hypothetical protein VGL97_07120 [Bryobacteraceae bacterium]|jgi:hypothetical protein
MSGRNSAGFASAVLATVCPLCSQFYTKLEPQTTAAFEAYIQKVEQQLKSRWDDRQAFFSMAASADDRRKLMRGDLLIRPVAGGQNPIEVPDGLIHDWTGAVFIPNANMQTVLTILQDFDRHSHIYPEIIRSHLIRHEGNDLTGYWRLERKQQFVPAVFDVEQAAHYRQIGPNRWICQSHSEKIREVEDAGSSKEKDMAPGEGLGLMWRLDAYWSLEADSGGVLAECRTVSLSRSIPNGMGWMIKPFIQNVPRESLMSTLRNTRRAVEAEGNAPK